MRNVLGLLVFLLILYVLCVRASDSRTYIDPGTITAFSFTKPCSSIDAMHERCDGVIITNRPQVVVTKHPAPRKLLCKLEE